MPELVFFRRGTELLRVALRRTRLVLGRGDNCDVVIPDPSVGRQQVALHYDGTRCLLEECKGVPLRDVPTLWERPVTLQAGEP